MILTYQNLCLRNIGYIADETQVKIRETHILVAGCGIGSSFAETAVRLGFEKLTLIDGDTVSASNLNRQNFIAADIGTPKVEALAKRLLAINPAAKIQSLNANITPDNVATHVAEADLVFDTIDFLDLVGIVALHDECRRQKKPAISALAIGWGAGCIYFPVGGDFSFRQMFGFSANQDIRNESYVQTFIPLVERIGAVLDPQVMSALGKSLTVMEDGKPCPASQVAPGAYSVGALAGTLAVRIVADLPVLPAPNLLLADMPTILTRPNIDLSR